MPKTATSEQYRLRFLVNRQAPMPVRRKKYTLCVSLESDFCDADVEKVARNVFSFFHNHAIDCGNSETGFGKLLWTAGSWLIEAPPTDLHMINSNTRQLAFTTFSTMSESKVKSWINELMQQCAENIRGHSISGTLTHKVETAS